MHLLDGADPLGREAAPAHAFGVEAAHRSGWPSTIMNGGTSCETWLWKPIIACAPTANELEQAALAADDRPVAELDVAGQAR